MVLIWRVEGVRAYSGAVDGDGARGWVGRRWNRRGSVRGVRVMRLCEAGSVVELAELGVDGGDLGGDDDARACCSSGDGQTSSGRR